MPIGSLEALQPRSMSWPEIEQLFGPDPGVAWDRDLAERFPEPLFRVLFPLDLMSAVLFEERSGYRWTGAVWEF